MVFDDEVPPFLDRLADVLDLTAVKLRVLARPDRSAICEEASLVCQSAVGSADSIELAAVADFLGVASLPE